MTNISKLMRDDRGTSVVELAIVAPVLAGLLVGMVDISSAYSAKLNAEQAAQSAIEKVFQKSADTTVVNTLVTEASTLAGVPADKVTTDEWVECDGERQESFDATCGTNEDEARYLSVSVTATYSPFFPTTFGTSVNADGDYEFTGVAAIRTS